ncbi:MAG: cytochrome-c peroxidase [Saprospiraceae bacterium]|nr:cytochrome-c peroxidase [Saprospiraceae bacterium]
MKKTYILLLFSAATALLLAFSTTEPKDATELGQRLFADPILSLDSTISCQSCHLPEFAFADTARFSLGVGGRLGKRNAPSVMNMAARSHFFFDGRVLALEDQVLMPIQDSLEMRMTLPEVERRLRRHPVYAPVFQKLFGRPANVEDMATAIAEFVRTLETAATPYDRWMNDQPNGMSDAAARGRDIFIGKGRCFDCHFGADMTGDEFRNVGLFNGKDLNDVGRYAITKKPEDLGKFKVAGLRNVALTAPYMHNGQFKTLDEVIDFYNDPSRVVPDAINRDTTFAKPMNLTQWEKADLKAFLEAMTDDRFAKNDK